MKLLSGIKSFLNNIGRKKGVATVSNIDEAFKLIKSAFDNGNLDVDIYTKYREMYRGIKRKSSCITSIN